MNRQRLKAAEKAFFEIYPEGFSSPEMVAIGKKHLVKKRHEMALEIFDQGTFTLVDQLIDNTVKLVSRSSLVSVFEKPKFKSYMNSLEEHMKHQFADALYQMIHGDMEKGFDDMIEVLLPGKLAKWSIMSVWLYYYYPNSCPFVKPTTAKNVIKVFEIEDIVYKPRPSYSFYMGYKKALLEMAKEVDDSLFIDFASFTGFLMITMDTKKPD